MRTLPVIISLAALLSAAGLPGMADARLPVERESQSETRIVFSAGRGVPIGSIETSSHAGSGRRLGPWHLETGHFSSHDELIFFDDGAVVRGGGSEQRRHPQEGRRCSRTGNVTTCR